MAIGEKKEVVMAFDKATPNGVATLGPDGKLAKDQRPLYSIEQVSELQEKLDNKQDELTFDDSPEESSENPVKSGGVYKALSKISVDYIVEQGNSGVWTYRKWNSGKAECWMSAQANATVSGWESFGSLYYNRLSSLRTDFPSGLFISTPLYFPSVRGSTYDVAAWIALIGGDTTATAPASYALFRPAVPGGASVFNICAYAFGRWK